MCVDPGEAEKTCELAASGFKHFSPPLPSSIPTAAAAPSPPLALLSGQRGGWGLGFGATSQLAQETFGGRR